MQEEQQFRKSIIQIEVLAKKQKNAVLKEQVGEVFSGLNTNQLEHVYKFLEDEKIKVFEDKEELDKHIEEQKNNVEEQTSSEKEAEDAEDVSIENVFVDNTGEEDEIRETNYLKMYLDELSELNETEHSQRLNKLGQILNKEASTDEIALMFLNDVVDIARLYEGQGVLVEDLIGEGNVALLMAAKMIECCETPTEAEEFITKNIMDAMENLIMENVNDDDFGSTVVDKVNDLNDKAKELSDSLMRKVTVEELKAEYELSEDEINEIIRLSGDLAQYIDVEEKREEN